MKLAWVCNICAYQGRIEKRLTYSIDAGRTRIVSIELECCTLEEIQASHGFLPSSSAL